MAEPHPRADLDQPRGLCAGAAASAPSPMRSAARQSSVTSPTGSAAASSSRRRVSAGNGLQTPHEALLDPARERHRRRARPNPPASWAGERPRGQLQQRERIARASRPRSARGRDRRAGRRSRSSAGRARRRRPALRPCSSGSPASSRPSPGSRTANTSATELRREPARDERERLRGDAVQPLRVVDRRRRSGRSSAALGEQAQDGRDRPGSDPAARPRSGRTPCRSASRCGAGRCRGGRASVRTAGAGRRTAAPSRTRRRRRARRGNPTRAPARCSSRAVLPTPASPRRTSDLASAPPGRASSESIERLALVAATEQPAGWIDF